MYLRVATGMVIRRSGSLDPFGPVEPKHQPSPYDPMSKGPLVRRLRNCEAASRTDYRFCTATKLPIGTKLPAERSLVKRRRGLFAALLFALLELHCRGDGSPCH